MEECGTHQYGNISRQKVDAIIKELKAHGATVTGVNPWDVDTHQHSVKLTGEWTEATVTLAVTVTDRDWYVPCQKVWEMIDDLMHHIQGLSDTEIGEAQSL
jgi:hypothetical protein